MNFLENYKLNHQHPVNRAIHTVGIPLIALAVPLLFFNRKIGLGLWVFGWVIQFIGHAIEGSSPAILNKGASPVANMLGSFLILAAIPLLAWHWFYALLLLLLAVLLSVGGNLLKGVPASDLSQTGMAYFIGGLYWWLKKMFGRSKPN